MMGAISLKAGRESGRVYVENTDLEPVNSENITITEAEDTLNDSLSETRLLSSSESEEEEQEDPFLKKEPRQLNLYLLHEKQLQNVEPVKRDSRCHGSYILFVTDAKNTFINGISTPQKIHFYAMIADHSLNLNMWLLFQQT